MTLDQYLKQNGDTARALAARCGLTPVTISRIRRGRVDASANSGKQLYFHTDGAVTEFGEWPSELAARRAEA